MKNFHSAGTVTALLLTVIVSMLRAEPIIRINTTVSSEHARRLLSKRTPLHYNFKGPHLDMAKGDLIDSILMATFASNAPTDSSSFLRYFNPSDGSAVPNVFRAMLDPDPKDANDPNKVGPPPFDQVTLWDGDLHATNMHCKENDKLLAYVLLPGDIPAPPGKLNGVQVHLCDTYWTFPDTYEDASCNEAATWTTAAPQMVSRGSILLHMLLTLDILTKQNNNGVEIRDHQWASGAWGALKFKLNVNNQTPRENAENFHWYALEHWWIHHCFLGDFKDPPQLEETTPPPYIEIPGQWI